MVILICILVILLCFSFGYNLFHFVEFRCYNKYLSIIQKYVNYAGYKHLDIKFTKQEKLILKNLESCK